MIAAPPGLGTINHTLLTLEAARAAGLGVEAVVLTPWPRGLEPGRGVQSRDDRLAGRGSELRRCLDLTCGIRAHGQHFLRLLLPERPAPGADREDGQDRAAAGRPPPETAIA